MIRGPHDPASEPKCHGHQDGDDLYGGAGLDKLIGGEGDDVLWGGADADVFVFKSSATYFGHDTVMDFEDGLDRLIFAGNGVTSYSNSGVAGSVFAYDQADGDALIWGFDGAGNEISVLLDDPTNSLLASNFSSADFVFA